MKIRIANEEVLASNDFTINQEMLNTPSVILNNVYPKTWELDKDYTSRFYHPDDYSQCQIVEDHEALPGENVEGTNFQINVDNTLQSNITHLKGQTTQNGTPTPTTPIPIETTTGNQEIVVLGKNLFDNSQDFIPNLGQFGTTTKETIPTGIKLTFTGTTSTSQRSVYFMVGDVSNYVGKRVRVYADFIASASNNGRIQAFLCESDGTNRTQITSSTISGRTREYVISSLSGTQTYMCIALATNYNGTVNTNDYVEYTNITITIDNEDVSYEPYISKTTSINLGKNLLDLSTLFRNKFGGDTASNDGITFTNNNGTINLSGTATDTAECVIGAWNGTTPLVKLDSSKTYTLKIFGKEKY